MEINGTFPNQGLQCHLQPKKQPEPWSSQVPLLLAHSLLLLLPTEPLNKQKLLAEIMRLERCNEIPCTLKILL